MPNDGMASEGKSGADRGFRDLDRAIGQLALEVAPILLFTEPIARARLLRIVLRSTGCGRVTYLVETSHLSRHHTAEVAAAIPTGPALDRRVRTELRAT